MLKSLTRMILRMPFSAFDEYSTHRVENLGWTHIRFIMRLENKDERSWYLKETAQQKLLKTKLFLWALERKVMMIDREGRARKDWLTSFILWAFRERA